TPATASIGKRTLLLQPNQPLDLFFRVPAEALLVFSLPPGTDPASLAIDAESPKARASLSSNPWKEGDRIVSLGKFAEQRIRLRLTRRASRPRAIGRP